ncbi:MAG: hypothetical protein SF187_22050 [Deltaproteobacteria bacterium]|nr:hypothetical protein [Deltaproteobacteria bacterium]
MKHAFALSLIIVVGACGSNSNSGDGDDPDGGGGEGGGGSAPAPVCSWNEDPEVLPLPEGSVDGVIEGDGRNRSTTCTTSFGTGGPDAVYKLELQERRQVHLAVRSTMNTAIAVRRACEDPLTEVACGATPLPNAGVPGQPGTFITFAQRPTVDAEIETVLDPGTYYVVVDEEAAFGVGGKFTLDVATSEPPVGLTCEEPEHLEPVDSRLGQAINSEDPQVADCGTPTFNARFYSVSIAAGDQLTATATPRGGNQSWQPVMQVQGGCDEGSCLGADVTMSQFSIARSLRFTNNGQEPIDVTLAVGANTALSSGSFDLHVFTGPPQLNTTCRAALRVRDGQQLRNQIISAADPVAQPCVGFGAVRGHYYQADVPPGNTFNVKLLNMQIGKAPPPSLILLRGSACNEGLTCDGTNQTGTLSFKNQDTRPTTIVFAVVANNFGFDVPDMQFGLDVSLIPPPGRVEVVNRQNNLWTSEAGDAATFQVRLSAAPSSDVAVPLASSNTNEGTVTPAKLVFTAANWDKPQTVVVLPVDDKKRDGAQNYVVQILPATGDRAFAGFDADDVTITNRDNEAGINVRRASSLMTNEAGAVEFVPVQLNVAPKGTVRIKITSSKPAEASVSPAELEFTSANWDVDQVVTVTGVNDDVPDGDQSYSVTFEVASSTDPTFFTDLAVRLDGLNRERAFAERMPASLPMPAGGSFDCSLGFSRWDRRITNDAKGILYVALVCSADTDRPGATPSGTIPAGLSQVFVTTSRDGGSTFGEPTPLPLFGASNVSLASGSGTVYVLASTDSGPAFVRSDTGGAVWSAPTRLSSDAAGFAAIVATAKIVLIGQVTNERARFWRNETAGDGDFVAADDAVVAGTFALFHDGNGQDFWMVNAGGNVAKRAVGGSAMFASSGALGFSDRQLEQFASGANVLWAVGSQDVLLRQSVVVDKTAQSIPLRTGLLFGRSLSADSSGGVTLFETGFDRSLRARHFAAAGNEDSPVKVLARTAGATSVQALGGQATAYAYAVGKQQFFGIVAW